METSVIELNHGTAQVSVRNHTGFTQRLEQGLNLSILEEGEIISSTLHASDDSISEWNSSDKLEECVANAVTSNSWRRDKVHEMFYDSLQLCRPDRMKFVNFS